jgi:hypothetical protein
VDSGLQQALELSLDRLRNKPNHGATAVDVLLLLRLQLHVARPSKSSVVDNSPCAMPCRCMNARAQRRSSGSTTPVALQPLDFSNQSILFASPRPAESACYSWYDALPTPAAILTIACQVPLHSFRSQARLALPHLGGPVKMLGIHNFLHVCAWSLIPFINLPLRIPHGCSPIDADPTEFTWSSVGLCHA